MFCLINISTILNKLRCNKQKTKTQINIQDNNLNLSNKYKQQLLKELDSIRYQDNTAQHHYEILSNDKCAITSIESASDWLIMNRL